MRNIRKVKKFKESLESSLEEVLAEDFNREDDDGDIAEKCYVFSPNPNSVIIRKAFINKEQRYLDGLNNAFSTPAFYDYLDKYCNSKKLQPVEDFEDAYNSFLAWAFCRYCEKEGLDCSGDADAMIEELEDGNDLIVDFLSSDLLENVEFEFIAEIKKDNGSISITTEANIGTKSYNSIPVGENQIEEVADESEATDVITDYLESLYF